MIKKTKKKGAGGGGGGGGSSLLNARDLTDYWQKLYCTEWHHEKADFLF